MLGLIQLRLGIILLHHWFAARRRKQVKLYGGLNSETKVLHDATLVLRKPLGSELTYWLAFVYNAFKRAVERIRYVNLIDFVRFYFPLCQCTSIILLSLEFCDLHKNSQLSEGGRGSCGVSSSS